MKWEITCHWRVMKWRIPLSFILLLVVFDLKKDILLFLTYGCVHIPWNKYMKNRYKKFVLKKHCSLFLLCACTFINKMTLPSEIFHLVFAVLNRSFLATLTFHGLLPRIDVSTVCLFGHERKIKWKISGAFFSKKQDDFSKTNLQNPLTTFRSAGLLKTHACCKKWRELCRLFWSGTRSNISSILFLISILA